MTDCPLGKKAICVTMRKSYKNILQSVKLMEHFTHCSPSLSQDITGDAMFVEVRRMFFESK